MEHKIKNLRKKVGLERPKSESNLGFWGDLVFLSFFLGRYLCEMTLLLRPR